MAAARWEELLPKWNRAAWGLHQQLAWGNPPNWKMLQQTTAKHSLSVVAINIFFKRFPVFFLSLFCSFCFWLHPDHHAMITLSCISLVCKRMVNYFIFTGILIFPQDYRGSAEGDSKNCMEVSRWWVIFLLLLLFLFCFWWELCKLSGEEKHCDVADRGKILQAAVYCSGCLWELHGYAN